MLAPKRNMSIHPASLIDASSHSQALIELLEIRMSRTLIEYVLDCVIDTVHVAFETPSSSFGRGRSSSRNSERARLTEFMAQVISKAEVKVPVLLVTLAYIERAKPYLHIAVEQYAHERVFLGALILAYKYLNDATLKNYHWAICTGVFGSRDIGRIEREFLQVLDYSLSITEDDLLAHHEGIISLTQPERTYIRSIARCPLREQRSLSVASHWSSDSDSDIDDDSDCESSSSMSSASSTSLPRTPNNEGSVSPSACIVISTPQTPDAFIKQASESQHRVSSTLKLLRSFPVVPFHRPAAAPRSRPIAARV